MRVLIIGGTGLISTAITRQLAAAGHDVTILTRGETDRDIPDSVDRLYADRTEGDAFAKVLRSVDVDCVIDMICFTRAEAELAIDALAGRIDRYIFCSTVDVYHRPPVSNPVTESFAREPPVSEYAAGKTAAEDAFFDAHDRSAFEVVTLRPWNTYGESGRLVHTFGLGSYYLDRIRAGKPIVVHGDGTSLWGPCHREDVARAFVGAVEANGEVVDGRAYNVTSEEAMTWNQYHRRVAAALDAPEPTLVHIPTDVLRRVDPDRTDMLLDHFQYSTVFDNTAAKGDLGFAPAVDFETGVYRTVDWLDANHGIDPWESEPRDDRLIKAWRESNDAFASVIGTAD